MKKNQITFSSALVLFFAVLLFSGYDASAQRHRRHFKRHHHVARPHVRVFVPAPPLVLSVRPPLAYAPRYRYYHHRDHYRRDYYRHDRRHDHRYDRREYRGRHRNHRDYDRYDDRRNY